jgi:LysM repeat protein
MKLPQLLTRKKLRATTARRALGAAEMDYEEMSEPNMKLSRALLIVLVLHVVAVAGIIAFNTIKTRQGPPPMPSESLTAKAVPAASTKTESPAVITSMRSDEPKIVKAPPKAVAKDERKNEPVKPAEKSPAKLDARKTYVVAKGDSPVSIARKLKVPYDDLMAANHIDDPHKLQIGQKLIIPAKPTKSKKGD